MSGAVSWALSHDARSGSPMSARVASRLRRTDAIPSSARAVAPASRSVSSACVWGRSASRANVEPPL